MSARNGTGLEPWFERLTSAEQTARTAMTVDYALYAEGEALLGWLNSTVQLRAAGGFDADAVLQALAGEIQRTPAAEGAQVAHLKMTLSPDRGLGDLAAINLVRNDYVPELSLSLDEGVESGQLIVNLRAEAPPELLRRAVEGALSTITGRFTGLQAVLEHVEQFRPGKPVPTHRVTDAPPPLV